jgi:hypothetical protein
MLYLEGPGTKKDIGRKKEMRLRKRSSLYMTKSTKIDRRRKPKEVGIDDKNKESMDKGTILDI